MPFVTQDSKLAPYSAAVRSGELVFLSHDEICQAEHILERGFFRVESVYCLETIEILYKLRVPAWCYREISLGSPLRFSQELLQEFKRNGEERITLDVLGLLIPQDHLFRFEKGDREFLLNNLRTLSLPTDEREKMWKVDCVCPWNDGMWKYVKDEKITSLSLCPLSWKEGRYLNIKDVTFQGSLPDLHKIMDCCPSVETLRYESHGRKSFFREMDL